jgi:hypothetical protein
LDLQGLPLFLGFFENFENLVFPLFSGLRGERGSCLFLQCAVKYGLRKAFILSDTSTDTSLFDANYSKF